MQVSFQLEGKRGQRFRMLITPMGADVGGGLLFEIQRYTAKPGEKDKWTAIASTREPTGDMSARVLAGWLAAPMPPPVNLSGERSWGAPPHG